MENQQVIINPAVLLKVSVDDPYKVELVDNLVMSSVIREKALMPFLGFLGKSLSRGTDTPELLVPQYALNEVNKMLI